MNWLKAVLVSVAAHAAIFAFAWFCISSGPVESPSLDLSSVELSFSDTPRPAQALAPLPPAPDAPAAPKPPDIPPPGIAGPPDAAKPPAPPVPRAIADILDDMEMPDIPDNPAMPDIPDNPQTPETPGDTVSPETPPEPPVAPPEPPAPAPRQARIDAPPRPKKTIKPEYPSSSRIRGEEGAVRLELTVSAQGDVESVTVVGSSGFPDLDAAAVRAAKTARFVPAKSAGERVGAKALITLSFHLR